MDWRAANIGIATMLTNTIATAWMNRFTDVFLMGADRMRRMRQKVRASTAREGT